MEPNPHAHSAHLVSARWRAALTLVSVWALTGAAARSLAQPVIDSLSTLGGQPARITVRATGIEVYVCRSLNGPHKGDPPTYHWVESHASAELTDAVTGAEAGHLSAGPTWEAADGSRVGGKLAGSVSAPGSLGWAVFEAGTHLETGLLSRTVYIRQAFTSGGRAPRSGCDAAHAGSEAREPFTAVYIFYGP